MRHGVKNNHLGRTTPHRKALLRNLSIALITHKRIVTTLAKAKALRIHVEPILTKSKVDTMHQRRIVFSYLQDNDSIKELFGTISAKIADRPGGYCRIIKMDRRLGDAADMAMIELVDFNEIYNLKAGDDDKKKTRRSRAKKTTDAVAPKEAKAPKAKATEEVMVEDAVEATTSNEVIAEVAAVEAVVVETPAVEAVADNASETVPEALAHVDDLTVVEGIGPKIAELCNAKGIYTFAQLAATPEDTLDAMLDAAGPAYSSHNPGTWAKQAQLAADGKMDELKAWQDELKGGKEEGLA
jgi:large subunit ribosomal protein L17